MWMATVSTSTAIWVQQLVVGWVIYDLSRSALLTSLGLGVGMLPLLMSPLGGLLADALDRRKLLAFSFAYRGAVALGFSVVVILGLVETWHIFLFSLMMGLGMVVTAPAWSSLVGKVVPKENLVNAFALTTLGSSITGLAVPVVAGLLVVFVGPGVTMLLGATMYVASSSIVMAVRSEGPGGNGLHRRSALSELAYGVRYVARDRLLMGVVLLAAVPAILAIPFLQGLMPVFASEVFEVGPAGLGMLMSALAAGATLGTFALASLGTLRRKGLYLIFGLALASVAMIAFSRSPSAFLAVPVLVLVTGGLSTFHAVGSAVVQTVVPDELRGRVSSLNSALMGLSPLGFVLSGGLAALLGAPMAVLIAGSAIGFLLLGLSLRFRRLRRFE